MMCAHVGVSYTSLSEDELLYFTGTHTTSPPRKKNSFFVDFKGLVLGLPNIYIFNILPLFFPLSDVCYMIAY